MQRSMNIALIGTALVWAGVSLGGNLVAAPAKFSVEGLALPELLQVGRAQFRWIGYVEFALTAIASIVAYCSKSFAPKLIFVAILAFAVQRAVIMPELSDQTDMVINGQLAANHTLHIAFVGAELIKCSTLLVLGFWAVSHSQAFGAHLEA